MIRFDGSVNMQLPDSERLGLVASDHEIFLVARSTAPGLQYLIDDDQADSHHHGLRINDGAGATFIPHAPVELIDDDRADAGVVGQFSDGMPHLFGMLVSHDVGSLFVDGVLSPDVVRSAVSSTKTGLVLGSDFNLSEGFVGDIAEVLMYSRGLTGAERAQVQTYLAGRWDIVLVPEPSAHLLLLWATPLLLLTYARRSR